MKHYARETASYRRGWIIFSYTSRIQIGSLLTTKLLHTTIYIVRIRLELLVSPPEGAYGGDTRGRLPPYLNSIRKVGYKRTTLNFA